MKKRVTIIIDEDLDKKIRAKQAKQIQQKQESVSYSQVIQELVKAGLK